MLRTVTVTVSEAAPPSGRLPARLPLCAEWERQLERYADAHPDVKIFDRPLATVPIRHRGTMLSMLDSGGWVFEVRGWHTRVPVA